MSIAEQHPDPITEGFSHTSQRLVQLVAVAVVASQIHLRWQHQRRQAEHAQALADQRRDEQAARAAFNSAKSRWAPAHDAKWLRDADLLQTARAWSAALPYTTQHAAAASAVRKCEERLRTLHPHAMEHYDRFRTRGLSAEEAMRGAAPFFARDPNVRTGHAATTRQLTEGSGAWWAANEHGPLVSERDEHLQRRRAQQLIDRIQAECRAHDLPAPTPGELRTALETATDLPGRIITRAVAEATGPFPDAQVRAAPPARRTPGQVARDDFPYVIDESMYLAAQQPASLPQAQEPYRPHTEHPRRRNR